MTTLSLFGGDWLYSFEDDNVNALAGQAGLQSLSYVGGPVRTTVALYSELASFADDFQAMGFKNPMLPVTPNAFTMENQTFISRASSEKLKEGAITADWSLVGSAGNNAGRGVLRVAYTGGTGPDAGDIGRRITQADTSDTGTLLDFEEEPDGTTVAWIRPDDSTPSTGDVFDGTGALTATGGTMSTTSSVAGTSGFTRFTAVQAIGSVPTATEVYLIQNRVKLANSVSSTGFQFWDTDTAVSLGIISVLIRTHNAAASLGSTDAIGDADLEVFSRRYTSLYDNFRLNVLAGGFSALPLASAPDINNTTGYRQTTGSSGAGTFTVGAGLYAGTSPAAEVHMLDDGNPAGDVDETVDFNDAGANDVNVWPAAEAVEDKLVIGFDKQFDRVTINVGTARVGGAMNWEYWNGTIWTPLSGVTDDTTSLSVTGTNDVSFTIPTDWARTSVNGSTSVFFISATVTTATVTTIPLITQGFINGFSAATKKGVITSVAGTVSAPILQYYLIGDLTDFAASDALTEFVFTTGVDGDATATAGAPIAAPGGPTETGAGNGGTVTIVHAHSDVDHTGDGTTEPYSITVDAQTNVPIAKVYERIKYATRRGATAADLFGAGTNQPGETYRGISNFLEYDASAVTITAGDDILTTTGGNTWTARAVAQSTGTTPTYITVMDEQTSLDSVVDNDVITDEGTGTLTVHAGGTQGIRSVSSPKSSPLGTFTGTQIFGAPGVAYINPDGADTQAYILTDDFAVLNNPPNTISFTVTNLLAGDHVYVGRDTGTLGVIDKDQFGGMTAVAASSKTITVAGTVDTEVPTSGTLRVVENTLQQEHRYHYASRTTGASGVFTLVDITAATAGAGTSPTALVKVGGPSFVTEGVAIGMMVRDVTNGDIYEVTAVTDADNLVIKQIFGTGGTFASGDSYEINETIQLYATSDDLFDLILDDETTGTTAANTFVKAGGSFGSVVQVRRGKSILPFEQNQSVGQVNVSVTAVRTPDTVAV